MWPMASLRTQTALRHAQAPRRKRSVALAPSSAAPRHAAHAAHVLCIPALVVLAELTCDVCGRAGGGAQAAWLHRCAWLPLILHLMYLPCYLPPVLPPSSCAPSRSSSLTSVFNSSIFPRGVPPVLPPPPLPGLHGHARRWPRTLTSDLYSRTRTNFEQSLADSQCQNSC